MRLPSVPSRVLADHVNSTYFHELWNAPNANARLNFGLVKASVRIKTGSVPVGLSVVGLPTTDTAYAVYQAPLSLFDRYVALPSERWITDADLFSSEDFTLTLFAAGGRVCPMGKVFLYAIPERRLVLLAVSVTYTQACLGELFPALYGTLYRDASRAQPTVSATYTISTLVGSTTTPTLISSQIITRRNQYPHGTIVTINGWVYDPTTVPTLVNGDIVTITCDPDIVGYCDIPIDNNVTGYYSTMYSGGREILHIPKALNPNNYILTHDTLTAVVFDRITHRGVIAHRVDAHAVEAITHNDFSIGRVALNAFSESLGASGVSVRVYVRYPTTLNPLPSEVNQLRDLYSLDDTTILNQLLGLASPQLEEWKAVNLEQSPFLNLLYDFNGTDPAQIIPAYTAAMGYYNLAAVLGQQMRYYTYKGAQVSITKPARLFGYPCAAIVYCNGRKLPRHMYAMSGDTTESFLLGFPENSGVEVNDRIAVYITEDASRNAVKYTPTISAPGIVVGNDDYSVVMVTPYATPVPVWNGSVTVGYTELTQNTADYTVTTNANGTYTYEVRSRHYGKTFYLVPRYGIDTMGYNLYTPLASKRPLVMSLGQRDVEGNLIPLLAYAAMEVYISGLRLVEGIDYTVSTINAGDGSMAQRVLVISNWDYLHPTDLNRNYLEVVVHGDAVVSEDVGYVVDRRVTRSSQTPVFARSSSRAFVNGVLQETIVEDGDTLTIGGTPPQGGLFTMGFNLAFGAKKLLSGQSPNGDLNRRGRIDRVLGHVAPVYPQTVVVDHLHAVYSPFLALVISDVAEGSLILVDEPKVDRFLKQLKAYTWLLQKDPTLGPQNPLIDRRFVTLAAHYANFTVTNITQLQLVQRLITLVLTPSELSIEEVLL